VNLFVSTINDDDENDDYEEEDEIEDEDNGGPVINKIEANDDYTKNGNG